MIYINLNQDYNDLLDNYQILTGDYDTLFDDYNALQSAYNGICNTIKQSILPVQYSFFAEAVRRYYLDIYLNGLSEKSYWMSFAEFCRDIVLHDSEQYNSFTTVSDAFSDALRYGSDTMYLADDIMYWTFYPWLPNWDGWEFNVIPIKIFLSSSYIVVVFVINFVYTPIYYRIYISKLISS